ncbi:DUF4864 domain-containing protein [Marinobacter sp. NP-4(2019)]|uniref:DUF4864 domain-containing protein n=1 Tax=Marinobacter sp. NP-4(2019) TaxID=2488665 RepID=UPI000FC3F2CA|nr:DUF4864 domain-containing protein [Marinobacter sp. NP-4(2019)]AZT82090.1 DUF4864 domain-containing protein [Marinobacter sp. NP-4(2019)]
MTSSLIRARTGPPVLLLIAVLVFLLPASPQADNKDSEIQGTILRQIEAFANDDGEAAWRVASEGIKRRFGSSEVFLAMVKQSYPAVHRASAIEFLRLVPHGDFEIQVVRLKGPEGKRWDAYYRMVLVDGQWKIGGVQMQPADLGI